MKLDIFECQPGMFCRPTGKDCYGEPYSYQGYDKTTGLHIFRQGTKREGFQKRKSPADWHIKWGAWCYEFVRSLP